MKKILYVSVDSSPLPTETEELACLDCNLEYLFAKILEDSIISKYSDVVCEGFVSDYKSENLEVYRQIIVQWENIIGELIEKGDKGAQIYSIKLPMEYREWLRWHDNESYREIGNKMECDTIDIPVQELYDWIIKDSLMNRVALYLKEKESIKQIVFGTNANTTNNEIKQLLRKVEFMTLKCWRLMNTINNMNTMENNVEVKIKQTEEKFQLLVDNINDLDIQGQLTIASSIRDGIVGDVAITKACGESRSLYDSRKRLLAQIKDFQSKVIDGIVSRKTLAEVSIKSKVKDFNQAKCDLIELAEKESVSSLFEGLKEMDMLKEIPECATHAVTLNTVVEQCKNGKYNVLLLGEYQSGKTTTVDAICEGRHIGAIGDGTATSAVPIAVSYGEIDSIRIMWKTESQFVHLFSHITRHFKNLTMDGFDINNIECRNKWFREIEKLRTSEYASRINEDEIRYLAICSFVLYHYNAPDLLREQKRLTSISDVSAITRFPKQMETRWRNKGVKDFTFEEKMFAFIERLDCYTPSETLKKLNCTIIDCPGLFNSSYDTEITEMAMAKAHAIMYLLPYHKAIAQDVCKSLYTIKDNYKDIHRKIFFVNNLNSQKDNMFYSDNEQKIKQMFGKNIIPFDAMLSYMGRIMESYMSHKLSDDDVKNFIGKPYKKVNPITKKVVDVKYNGFEEAWNAKIQCYTMAMRWNLVPKAEIVVEESGFNKVVNEIKRFVETNEAYSIILSSGIEKMASELSQIKNRLITTYVEPYRIGKEKTKDLWNKRLEKAEKFDETVKRLIKKVLLSSSLEGQFSDEIYGKLFTSDFYDSLAKSICGAVYDNKGKLIMKKFNKEAFKRTVTPIITKVVEKHIESKFEYWNTLLKTGQDSTFNNRFTPEIRIFEKDVFQEWRDLFDDDSNFKMDNYITIPKGISCLFNSTLVINGVSVNSFNGGTGTIALGSSLLAEIAVYATSIATIVTSIIISIIMGGLSNPVGWIALLVTGLAASIVIVVKGPEYVRREFVNSMYDDVKDKLINIHPQFKDMIRNQIHKILSSYTALIGVNFNLIKNERDIALSSPDDILEKRCFMAVNVIDKIDKQIKEYNDFKTNHVVKGE